MEEVKTKKCTTCGQEKPVSEFYKDSHAKDGLRSQCKDCCKASRQVEEAKEELDDAMQEHLEQVDSQAVEQAEQQPESRKPLTPEQMSFATIDWEQRTFDTASRIFAQLCAVQNPTKHSYTMCIDYARTFVSEYMEKLKSTENEQGTV